MKKLHRLLTVGALWATAAQAAPFLAVGDNAEVFLTSTVGVRSDSNIFMTPRNEADTILDFSPGLDFVFGNGAALKGNLSAVENFTRYEKSSGLNDSLAAIRLRSTYDDGKSKASFGASFEEFNQNTVDVQGTTPIDALILRDVLSVNGGGEVSVTQKSKVALNARYVKTRFELATFSDSDVLTLPFNYYYEVTPKVDLSLGYRYRQRWEQLGRDSKDHYLNVGSRGDFTPKLSGEVSVGLSRRVFSVGANASSLGVDTNLSYALSPKTSLQFGASNDFDTNSQGQQQKVLSLRLTGETKISEEWSFRAGVNFRRMDYTETRARVDSYYDGLVSTTYVVNSYLSITGSFNYRTNKSDQAASDFEGNVLSVAAKLRF